jgi:D-tyrosyl-tRNA(Tyr) deacylase
MRAVVQRVKEARVDVEGVTVGEIAQGLLVFLGVGQDDSENDVAYLANKVAHLRVFPDEQGLMNVSLAEIRGSVLVVSQFTLWGDCHKGRRPSFAKAAPPDQAEALYQSFIRTLRGKGFSVATGKFQEMMDVHLINDGPVTLIIDSRKAF